MTALAVSGCCNQCFKCKPNTSIITRFVQGEPKVGDVINRNDKWYKVTRVSPNKENSRIGGSAIFPIYGNGHMCDLEIQ